MLTEKKKIALAKVAAANQQASNMFSAFSNSKVQNSNDILTVGVSSSDDDLDDHDADDNVHKHKSKLTAATDDKQTLTLIDQLKTQQSLIESLKQESNVSIHI